MKNRRFGKSPGKGIQQQLGWIEQMTPFGMPRTVKAIAIMLPGSTASNLSVPDVARTLSQSNPRNFLTRVIMIKKTEIHGGCVLRINRKIHRVIVAGQAMSAERIR